MAFRGFIHHPSSILLHPFSVSVVRPVGSVHGCAIPRSCTSPATEMGQAAQVPVIDLRGLQGSPVVDKIAEACKSWGVFQVINHGVAQDTIAAVRKQSRRLFALPTAQKLQAKRMPGSFAGYGNGAVVNSETLMDEYYSEAITLGFPSADAVAVSGKLWPEGNYAFCESVVAFSAAAHELALEILGHMVDGLHQETARDHLQAYLTERSGTLRVNNYPLCPQPSLHSGLPPHIDACVLTILHQGEDVAGLEVEKDGAWVGVAPRNDALVVIVAAIAQVLTNGTYKAVNHRALLNSETARLSLAYSAYPPPTVAIVPAPECVHSDRPSPYRTFTWQEFLAAKQKHVQNPLVGLLAEATGKAG